MTRRAPSCFVGGGAEISRCGNPGGGRGRRTPRGFVQVNIARGFNPQLALVEPVLPLLNRSANSRGETAIDEQIGVHKAKVR